MVFQILMNHVSLMSVALWENIRLFRYVGLALYTIGKLSSLKILDEYYN